MLVAAFVLYRSDQQSAVGGLNGAGAKQMSASATVPDGTSSTHALAPPSPTTQRTLANPHALIDLIVKEQGENVRESYGEAAGQNFSDQDLSEFIRNDIPARISKELKKDDEFLELVLAIKHMDPTERHKLLNEGLNKHKQTWRQMGRIDREGQTEAGQTCRVGEMASP